MTRPTPPIELDATSDRLPLAPPLPDGFATRLSECCAVISDAATVADASRDWWPLAMRWAIDGAVAQRAAAVARPTSTAEVQAVLRCCNEAGVAVTPAGGRSSVVGGAAPVLGGVLLDLTAMQGILDVDVTSGIVEVLPGTFGPDLEHTLRTEHRLTVGHFPQSFELSTVGGWVAARGAGQYSTRYGTIADMVAGLEVVLADGTALRTGGAPAAAQGPDLTQLFVGSEGTLGTITRVWLRAHPLPAAERRAAFAFDAASGRGDDALPAAVEACRTILRAGATPAVLRLYDAAESARGQGGDGTYCVLLVLDEGDADVVDGVMRVVQRACDAAGARRLDDELVDRWLAHRNDTSALQALIRKGYVVDTLEVAARWSALTELIERVEAALLAVPHARAATCHLSHSYLDGACVYFTFAATPPPDAFEATYVALWDAGQRAALAHGGNLSHHHGVGINRARFVGEALGASWEVLSRIKHTLDPNGIMNPGKLGFGAPAAAAPVRPSTPPEHLWP
ncbi:MAG: FAD-binding oxidoreductase [Ilumatobacteraceae bacterium]